MKKLNIIFALIISSFFLLSSNVSADTINFNVNPTDFDRINDTFFKVRELAINLAKEKNQKYLIIQRNYNDKEYYQVLLSNVFQIEAPSMSATPTINFNLLGGYTQYIYENDILNEIVSGVTYYGTLASRKTMLYQYYLDTSYDNLTYNTSNNDFTINYNDVSYLITYKTHVPSLYELYLENNKTEEIDPKAEIITNFYVLIIDKIKLLTDYIATDYIILSALVIFIFVAIVGLVRRLK